jgi:WD40 repeat protein
MNKKVFLSYARGDDDAFIRRLHDGLRSAAFDVWFDRVSMPSRYLTFHQEIRDAVAACDRLVLVVGPKAAGSDYVSQEWRFAYFEAMKCVNPILRRGDYDLIPDDLITIHAEDFRNDEEFDLHLGNLVRQLSDALPPAGKLVAVPELPAHYVDQPSRLRTLRDVLLADLRRPVIVTGAAARVGLQGMGGIGKTVLASALAHHPEVRRAFPDGVYWLTLGQEPDVLELQRQLARQLGDPGLFTSVEEGKETLRESCVGRAAMFVLDDVWQRPHAEAFNVVGPRGRLLLTTRDAGLMSALAALENHYQVQLLSQADAEFLLAKAAGVSPDVLPPEARSVVKACGRLPLALTLCGGMVRGGTSWQDLLEAFREHDLVWLADGHPAEDHHASIWRAMDASIRVLPDEQRDRFAELSVFGPDTGAPDAAVETLWEHTAGLGPRRARELLKEYSLRSLVALEGQPHHMTLHDLLHNFATHMATRRFGSESALHSKLLDAYFAKCGDGWPSGPNDGYLFQYLSHHLMLAGRGKELRSLLLNFKWLEVKLAVTDIHSLIADYRNLPEDSELKEVQHALRFAAQTLSHDKSQLAGQLTVRLSSAISPGIAALLRTAHENRRGPRLRPLRFSVGMPSGAILQTLYGHAGKVCSVAITADGSHAVSGSYDRTVKVWDLNRGTQIWTLKGHQAEVWRVAITADGRRAISGGWDKRLKVWDLERGTEILTLKGHRTKIWSLALTADGQRAISVSGDRILKVWDLRNGEELYALHLHASWTPAPNVAMTADGRWAVTSSHGCAIKVWDLNTGKEVRTIQGHTARITGIAVSANGGTVASSSYDGTLRVWDMETGTETWRLEASALEVAISADGRRLLSSYPPYLTRGDIELNEPLVKSVPSTLKVWDLETGTEVRSIPEYSGSVNTLAVSGDGMRAISGTDDNAIKIWDLDSGAEAEPVRDHLDSVSAIAVTANGSLAISGSYKSLKTWNVGEAQEIVELKSDWVRALGVSLSGREVISVCGGKDYTVTLWKLEDGNPIRTLLRYQGDHNEVAVSVDSRRLISGSFLGALTVWSLETGTRLLTLQHFLSMSTALAISIDGRRAISGSRWGTQAHWDIASGRRIRKLTGHSAAVNAVAISADSCWAISASADGSLRIWDLERGTRDRLLVERASPVNALALSADGHRAVAASKDHTLALWDLEKRQVIARFNTDATIRCCACSAEGNIVAAGDALGVVHLFRLE